jgi:hypothetical protein
MVELFMGIIQEFLTAERIGLVPNIAGAVMIAL